MPSNVTTVSCSWRCAFYKCIVYMNNFIIFDIIIRVLCAHPLLVASQRLGVSRNLPDGSCPVVYRHAAPWMTAKCKRFLPFYCVRVHMF